MKMLHGRVLSHVETFESGPSVSSATMRDCDDASEKSAVTGHQEPIRSAAAA
jgi:hypothetical protein